MATRRARFKPVLNQAARRGRPGAPDGQTVDSGKDVVISDLSEKTNPITPNQKALSAVKSEVVNSQPVKSSPHCETEKTISDSPVVLTSSQPNDVVDTCAEGGSGEKWPLKVSSSQHSRTPVGSIPKQDATPVELPRTPPARPSTPVSGPSEADSRSIKDIASPAKTDTSARSSKDDRKETAPSVKLRRAPSSTNQRALAARRNFMKLAKEGPPARSSLTMFDLIFYNPATNPMTNKSPPPPPLPAKKRDRQASVCSVVSSIHDEKLNEEKVDDVDDNQRKESEDKENKEEDEEEEEEEEEPAVPVPRVKVGPDGRIVIDEQSLVIETTETKKSRAEMEKSEVVFDTGLSNGFYKRTKRTKDWSNRDTLKFYRALQVYGTDFSLMQVLFKDRTRKELKQKFKKEERMRGHLIDKALCSPLNFDTTELEKQAQQEEEEEAARLAKEKEEKEKPKPKPLKTKYTPCSLAQREMCDPSSELNPTKAPPRKKIVRKPKGKLVAKAKDDQSETDKTIGGLDIFDDIVLPQKKKAAPKKRKVPPRDPSQPPKKIKKKANHLISPDSDHSYAASPARSPRTNGAPVSKPPMKPRPKPSSSDNNNVKQSPGCSASPYLTIDLSSHLILTPTRSAAASPNEFGFQYATLRTPKTPVNINITQSAGLPTEFGSPSGPALSKAVPIITMPHSYPSSGVTPLQPLYPSYPSSGVVPLQPLSPKVEPGSLYVLQTLDPNDPKRSVLGVYMVTNNQPKVVSPPPQLENSASTPPESLMNILSVEDPVEGTVLTKL